MEKAVADLGYQADTAAHVLAGGRSRTIGVVAVETDQFGPSQMLFGIEECGAPGRPPPQLRHTGPSRTRHGGDAGPAPRFPCGGGHRRGAGPTRRRRGGRSRARLAAVVVGGDPTIGIPTVTIDQHAGASCATTHLLDLGHRSVAHVRGPRSWIDAAARARGWADTLHNAGATPGPVLFGDWTAAGGYAAGTRLAVDPHVSAVFAANDQTALGVIRALHRPRAPSTSGCERGRFRRHPQSGSSSALTTIRQDFAEVGRGCGSAAMSCDGGVFGASTSWRRPSWSSARARHPKGHGGSERCPLAKASSRTWVRIRSPYLERTCHEIGNMSSGEIDRYLADLEEPKRSTLQRLRQTNLEVVPGGRRGM